MSNVCFIGCKKDKKGPVLSLIGGEKIEIRYDSIAIDPGVEAIDETDGDISNKVTSNWSAVINVKQRAKYNVTYKVADQRANESQADREVIVKMFGSNFIGNYNSTWVLITSDSGNSFYTISKGVHKNQFVIDSYGPHQIALKVNLSGDLGESLSFNQSDNNVTTEGTGTIENNGTIIKLNFRRAYPNGTSVHGVETLIRM